MKSMLEKDKEIEVEKLSTILSKIQDLYYKKKDQLEDLEIEINSLKEILSYLNSVISNRSFHSADEIYQKTLENFDLEKVSETYFTEEVPQDIVKGTAIKRKIFTKNGENEGDLVCVLNFTDFTTLEVKFINPDVRAIKETSEDFINIFLKGALIKIKDKNENISLEYEYFKDTDIIQYIKIQNLKTINDYDLITTKIRELVASDSFQF